MKMTLPLEEKFARDWIEGWNTHALERVLSHYADDFEMSSPFIGQFGGRGVRKIEGEGAGGGLLAIGAGTEAGFEIRIAPRAGRGIERCGVLSHQFRTPGSRGFFFNDQGLVERAAAHYDGE